MPKCAPNILPSPFWKSVKKCTSNTLYSLKKDGKSYFRFPKNELVREKWRRIIANERCDEYYKPNKSSVVCSNHFREGDMYDTKHGLRKLKIGTIPRIGVEPLIPKTQSGSVPTETYVLVKREPKTSTSSDILEPEHKEVLPFIEISVPNPASPASSGHSSIFDSPEVHYYKKTIKTYEEKLNFKSKQIQKLQRKVMRLSRGNQRLRGLVAELRKKQRVDRNLISKLTSNMNEPCTKETNTDAVCQ